MQTTSQTTSLGFAKISNECNFQYAPIEDYRKHKALFPCACQHCGRQLTKGEEIIHTPTGRRLIVGTTCAKNIVKTRYEADVLRAVAATAEVIAAH